MERAIFQTRSHHRPVGYLIAVGVVVIAASLLTSCSPKSPSKPKPPRAVIPSGLAEDPTDPAPLPAELTEITRKLIAEYRAARTDDEQLKSLAALKEHAMDVHRGSPESAALLKFFLTEETAYQKRYYETYEKNPGAARKINPLTDLLIAISALGSDAEEAIPVLKERIKLEKARARNQNSADFDMTHSRIAARAIANIERDKSRKNDFDEIERAARGEADAQGKTPEPAAKAAAQRRFIHTVKTELGKQRSMIGAHQPDNRKSAAQTAIEILKTNPDTNVKIGAARTLVRLGAEGAAGIPTLVDQITQLRQSGHRQDADALLAIVPGFGILASQPLLDIFHNQSESSDARLTAVHLLIQLAMSVGNAVKKYPKLLAFASEVFRKGEVAKLDLRSLRPQAFAVLRRNDALPQKPDATTLVGYADVYLTPMTLNCDRRNAALDELTSHLQSTPKSSPILALNRDEPHRVRVVEALMKAVGAVTAELKHPFTTLQCSGVRTPVPDDLRNKQLHYPIAHWSKEELQDLEQKHYPYFVDREAYGNLPPFGVEMLRGRAVMRALTVLEATGPNEVNQDTRRIFFALDRAALDFTRSEYYRLYIDDRYWDPKYIDRLRLEEKRRRAAAQKKATQPGPFQFPITTIPPLVPQPAKPPSKKYYPSNPVEELLASLAYSLHAPEKYRRQIQEEAKK